MGISLTKVMRTESPFPAIRTVELGSMKRKWIIACSILVALLLAMELAAYLLLRPNRVEVENEPHHLLTTRWHQVGDYARFVTLDDDAGCWAAAIAQIAHFHEFCPTGRIEYQTTNGATVRIDLDSVPIDHDEFVDAIDTTTPAEARDQVARYIYSIACILYTNFGGSGYLEHETFVERVEDHLGCAVGFHDYDKARYLAERKTITSLVGEEIAAERPLMLYFDNGDDFGHAAVIDGLIETEDTTLVHLNLGWGGRHDGWYDLFAPIAGVRDDLQNRFLITFDPSRELSRPLEVPGGQAGSSTVRFR